MPHLNNFQAMGHLGRAPELKQAAGKQLAEFTVAVSSGTMQKPDTIWLKCTVWGDRAQRVVEKLNKGDAVYVSGRLSIRAYQGKDGTPKAEASVMVNEWQALKGKGDAQPSAQSFGDIPQFDIPQFASTVPHGATTDDLESIPF
jgi:single-strand DNA-binding protein